MKDRVSNDQKGKLSKNDLRKLRDVLIDFKQCPSTNQLKFINVAGSIAQDQPDNIGFICRTMVAASMPHSKVTSLQYKRTNNNFTLSIIGNEEAGGIPYGTYPRLILSWLSTEVVRTRSREIVLGQSLSSFMRELGLGVSGGKWGTICRFREQLKRLFTSHITFTYHDKIQGRWVSTNLNIADKTELFWNPTKIDQVDVFKSKIFLSEFFYEEILKAPIPIDIRAINALKDSSLALDVYFWLTYRLSYLKNPLELSFDSLQTQFGGDYSNTAQGKYEFKRKFIVQLKKVLAIYQNAKIKIHENGLSIRPSHAHIVKSKL